MNADDGQPGPAPAAGKRRWRHGGLWLAVLALGYFGLFTARPGLFFAVGINHYDAWFIDTFALLASNDAVTRGLDPYAPNPLDYFHRPHVYSHWWLHLRDLGLTRADARWLGLALAGAFLGAALWRLRPSSGRQLAWYLFVLCSSPMLLAVDRGNNDLVIFLLFTPLVPALLRGGPWARWLAPLLIAVAAGLKYYPAAAGLLLLAGPDSRAMRQRVLLGLLLGLLAGLSVAGDLRAFGPLAPRPEGLMTFGATALFQELGWAGWGPKLVVALAGLAVAAWAWFRRPLGNWEPAEGQRSDWLHFVLGAVLLAGCFFTSMNFDYRWIFAIWLAPLAWTLPGDAAAPAPVRRLAWHVRWLLPAVLWWGPFCSTLLYECIGRMRGATIMQLASWGFIAEQPFDWAIFLCLLVFLVHFARRGLTVLVRVPA